MAQPWSRRLHHVFCGNFSSVAFAWEFAMRGFSNKAPAPNRRPRFPLGGFGEFEYPVGARPASPAAVGEARRSAESHAIDNAPQSGYRIRQP